VGITHLDEAPAFEYDVGHIKGRWTGLGEAAGSVTVGVRRIQVPAGGWTTPLHEHGRSEEIFYVLGGRGISLQRDRAAEIREGDCIVYLAGRGAHTCHALEPLDLLAFGPRERDEATRMPRIGITLLGNRAVESIPGAVKRTPLQFIRESEAGPPELPVELGQRPPSIVNIADVEPVRLERTRVSRTRRRVAAAAGSITTGLQHVEVDPGMESAPPHCHSLEEELFIVLAGDGVIVLDDEETPLRAGSVVARPAATGVSHMFRAGPNGLTYLAYGPRDPGDMCWYPRSRKIGFSGLGVIARVEPLEYWDGED
jgi:uncharacterized cupin superfamily protein